MIPDYFHQFKILLFYRNSGEIINQANWFISVKMVCSDSEFSNMSGLKNTSRVESA